MAETASEVRAASGYSCFSLPPPPHLRQPFARRQGLSYQYAALRTCFKQRLQPTWISSRLAGWRREQETRGPKYLDRVHTYPSEIMDWVASEVRQRSTDRRSVLCVRRTGVLLSKSISTRNPRDNETEDWGTRVRLLQRAWHQLPRALQFAKAGAPSEREFEMVWVAIVTGGGSGWTWARSFEARVILGRKLDEIGTGVATRLRVGPGARHIHASNAVSCTLERAGRKLHLSSPRSRSVLDKERTKVVHKSVRHPLSSFAGLVKGREGKGKAGVPWGRPYPQVARKPSPLSPAPE